MHEGCEIARAARGDGVPNRDIQELASLGTDGQNPQHELDQLHRLHDRNGVRAWSRNTSKFH